MARKKNKSMKWQVEEVLLAKLCIGQSKHEAKKKKREELKKKNENLPEGQRKNKRVVLEGIYSWNTYNDYKNKAIRFAEWAKKNYGCKTLESAKAYIQTYLENQADLGQSAWTIKSKSSAICKLYGVSAEELYLHTSKRKREDIKRSRFDCEHDKHVSEKKHRDIERFCKGTGVRRLELAAVYPKDIKYEKGILYVHVNQGKGGKTRDIPVHEDYYRDIDKYIGLPSNEPIFKNIPQNLDIHSYRTEFACSWYKKLARPLDTLTRKQKYYCKGDMKGVVYDRRAMMKVSKMLGHERINVIASNYLWRLK